MDNPSIKDHSYIKKSSVVYCFVPNCDLDSYKFPDKIFLSVPREPKLREKWMKAAKIKDLPSPKSVIRCCEDHFEMENDVENWLKYKLVGGNLILKKGVVPHIFDNQQTLQTIPGPNLLKHEKQVLKSIENELAIQQESYLGSVYDSQKKKTYDESIQVAIFPYKRSKASQATIKTSTNNAAVSPKPAEVKHQKLSPIKTSIYQSVYSDTDSDSAKSLKEPDYETSTTSGSVLSRSDFANQESEQKNLALQITIKRITTDSKLYMGIPNDSTAILDLIQEAINVPYHHIYLVLKKLKLNEPFKILGDDFGVHESTASRIFSVTCCKMANILKSLIIKPSPQSVLANLPIAFRDSFSKTYCIIDCLEIEIETPANALHQSLTYSSYKKCNTMKYLVSATPDGVINFISEGFGGRTSDVRICQESNFFDCLPPGVSVMADRGFKHIEAELAKKNFLLIRPPSVSSSEKSSKKEVLLSKKIASLRIHIERVIRRLREFSFLKPHACIDHNLIPYLDSAVIICCALVNLQPSLIKL